MKTTRFLPMLALAALMSGGSALAESSVQADELNENIMKKLRSLSTYGAFDWLSYKVESDQTVVLEGFASRPVLKNDAERAVQRIDGVETVENNIEVLPTSPYDDRIRARAYGAIYTHPSLQKYAPGGGVSRAQIERAAANYRYWGIDNMMITRGAHPIHIIVDSGRVTLRGRVVNKGDKQQAGVQVRSLSDVFEVNNELVAGNQSDSDKAMIVADKDSDENGNRDWTMPLDAAATDEMGKKIAGKLRQLPTYGAFDWLTFSISSDREVVLRGYASRPSLKNDAGRTVQRIDGVETVDNQIEVLPNSPADDRIRARAYGAIYTHPALRKYAPGGGISRAQLEQAVSNYRFWGLDSLQVTRGSHPIHIIVDSGHVTLLGTVNNKAEKQQAEVQVRNMPETFSITNKLTVEKD